MNETMSSEKHDASDPGDRPDASDGAEAEVTAAEQAAPDSRPQPPAPKSSGGRGLAFLALLVALAALALTGWAYYEEQVAGAADPTPSDQASADEERLQEFQARLDDLEGRLDQPRAEVPERIDQRLDELADSAERLGDRLAELQDRVDARFADEVAPLAAQMDDLTAAVDALAERLTAAVDAFAERGDVERQVDRDLRRQLAMLEAAALLRIGQERAELSADFGGAARAFQRAAGVLGTVDDARLDRARRALTREIETLENARPVDVNRELAQLDRLHRESRTWPMALDDRAGGQPSEPPVADEPESWRERIGAAVGGLVRIEARDDLGRSAEQFQAAREQLQLRLVAAQLAVSRHAPDALEIHLDAALALIDDWFDRTAEEVARARADLEGLKSLRFEPPAVELGEALDLLQARLDAF